MLVKGNALPPSRTMVSRKCKMNVLGYEWCGVIRDVIYTMRMTELKDMQ
jgi:hypothetical protein